MGLVVVGGRGVLLFKFSIFHSIENTCKKIFLWEYLPGVGGGCLSPQSPLRIRPCVNFACVSTANLVISRFEQDLCNLRKLVQT